LADDLERASDVAERADGVGAADRDPVRPLAAPFQIRHDTGDDLGIVAGRRRSIRTRGDAVDLRTQQVVQQEVALDARGRLLPGQDEAGAHPGHGRRGGRRSRVIRLQCPARHQHRRAPALRVGDEKLQLADLVAAEGEAAGEVVALDEDARTPGMTAEGVAQAAGFGERRWQVRQPDARLTAD
jgi:hypothetical protein